MALGLWGPWLLFALFPLCGFLLFGALLPLRLGLVLLAFLGKSGRPSVIDWRRVIAGLCVGWPAGKGFVSMRLPPALVAHTDRYCDDALEGELEAYDRRRHARAPLARDKQKNAQQYGTAEFC